MINQQLYSHAETLAVAGAVTANSVGLTPVNRPLSELSVEVEIAGLMGGTPLADFIVQTAPAGVAAGGNWYSLQSSRLNIVTTGTRFSIPVRDGILAQVRLQIVNKSGATWTTNIRWLSSRSLTVLES